MKRVLTLSVVAMIAALSIMPAAEAQFRSGRYGTNNINVVQSQLQARINAGVANGRLNQKEAARLQSKVAKISALEARMRASGNRLSSRERATLNTQLSNLSAQITRELNDFERRRVGYWGGRNNGRNWR
jgi:hypothetical protein